VKAVDYDAELRRHNDLLRRAAAVQLDDHVLDIGCGAGTTTRQAALACRAGSALGVDISAAAIERARGLARDAGLGNVTFELADAQRHRFAQQHFDLAVSRFGTMFFDDPVAAFTNIGSALRPGGRLVMLVWQAGDRNEWSTAIRRALAGPEEAAATGQAAFSLAEPAIVRQVLGDAGFRDIDLADVHEPVYYGANVATAVEWIRRFSCTSEILGRWDAAGEARALERLRETLTGHLGDDGVWLDSRAWLVTARRAAA
jgi:SAM-dependent methyltransferase